MGTSKSTEKEGREGGGLGAHGEVGGVALALPLGDGVEDDGGEVGHQVRRLPAQRRQVPHPRLCSALRDRRYAFSQGSLPDSPSEKSAEHHGRAPPPPPPRGPRPEEMWPSGGGGGEGKW